MAFEIPDSDKISDAPSGGGFEIPEDDKIGVMEAAGRGALRNFPFAQQATAAIEPGAYSDNLQGLVSKAEAAKAAHPTAYGAGAVAGTTAPLLLPVAGEALGASGMGLGALEAAGGAGIGGGAANAAAQSLSDADLTHLTGRDVAGAGISGALGAGLGALAGKFAPKAAAEVAGPESRALTTATGSVPSKSSVAFENGAEEAVTPGIIPRTGRTPVGIVPDQTPVSPDFVPSGDRIAASNFARGIGFTPRKFQAFAREMGENPTTAAMEAQKWSESKGLVQLLDHPGEALDRVSKIKDEAGKQIGGVIDKFGTQPVPAQQLQEELQQIAWHTIDPATEAKLLKSVDRIGDIAKKGWLDWNGLNKIKGMLGEHIKDDPAIARAYGVLAQRMTDMAEATGKKIGDPALKATYEAAKRDFRMASLLKPALSYAEAKNLIGGPAGHNTLRGVLGQMVEAMTGLPSAGQIGRNVLAKSAPIARSIGQTGENIRGAVSPVFSPVANAAVKGYGKLPQAAQLELSNALTSKFGKNKND